MCAAGRLFSPGRVRGSHSPGDDPPGGALCDARGNTMDKRDETMKTELMAAATACWRKVRASGRAWSEAKGNPHRLFRAAAAIALAIVIVPATALLGGGAFADNDPMSDGYQGSWHSGQACAPRYRISHKNTGCMHAWWDNTPPWSTGVAGGSTYGARNLCPNYGAMKANIDIVGKNDPHFHMSNGDKKRGRDGEANVRDIACCLNESDLCWKWSVEPQDGKIKMWKGTGTDYRWVDVSTQYDRYKFCSENPDNVYCDVDKKGDAFNVPETVMCGDEECDTTDCRAAFDDTRTSNWCSIWNLGYNDGLCSWDASCIVNGKTGTQNNFEIFIDDIESYLKTCGDDDPHLLGKFNWEC